MISTRRLKAYARFLLKSMESCKILMVSFRVSQFLINCEIDFIHIQRHAFATIEFIEAELYFSAKPFELDAIKLFRAQKNIRDKRCGV